MTMTLPFLGCLLLSSRSCASAHIHATASPSEIRAAFAFAGTGNSPAFDRRQRSPTQGACRSTFLRAPPFRQRALSLELSEAPSEPEPPHSALAQVLANQYSVDLLSVARTKGRGGEKITAGDVEYYAWTRRMPPCAEDAAARAYARGLDLNDIYDDEDGQYVIQLADVELFLEHETSLRMTSQTRKGTEGDNAAQSHQKRSRRMRALDERMERKLGKLSGKAMQFAGEMMQQALSQAKLVQQGVTANLGGGGGFIDMNLGASGDDIQSVVDFDASLASEIQEALSCVDNIDVDGEVCDVSELEELQSMMMGVDVINVEESNTDSNVMEPQAISAQEELQSATASAAIGNADLEDVTAADPVESRTKEELQSQTVVQLKEQLRGRGLKVSGRKSDLVERLFGCSNGGNKGNERGNLDNSRSPLFFASNRESDDAKS